MAVAPIKPSKQSRNSRKQELKRAAHKAIEQRKAPVPLPLQDVVFKPLG